MLKETRGCPGKAGRVVSLEPEYERLHRKMHAQLREIYRKNGGLPITEEFRAAALLHDLQIMMSYGYEPEKKAIVKYDPTAPEIPFNNLQEGVDIAIERAKRGIPSQINFNGHTAEVSSLLQVMKEIEPPDGVHVLPGPRVGDEQKNEYLERLREAAGGGYINLTETGARQDAILKAESREDLERLVKDLPPYKPGIPAKTCPEKKERAWTGPGVIVPALAALQGCYNSVMFGIHGSFLELMPSLVITGLFVILLCLGVAKGKSSGTP
jgi:hypothetical protein